MNNILYSGTVISATDSIDGESPTCVLVTQEVNGFALWLQDYDGTKCLSFNPHVGRDLLLEKAVNTVIEMKSKANK